MGVGGGSTSGGEQACASPPCHAGLDSDGWFGEGRRCDGTHSTTIAMKYILVIREPSPTATWPPSVRNTYRRATAHPQMVRPTGFRFSRLGCVARGVHWVEIVLQTHSTVRALVLVALAMTVRTRSAHSDITSWLSRRWFPGQKSSHCRALVLCFNASLSKRLWVATDRPWTETC